MVVGDAGGGGDAGEVGGLVGSRVGPRCPGSRHCGGVARVAVGIGLVGGGRDCSRCGGTGTAVVVVVVGTAVVVMSGIVVGTVVGMGVVVALEAEGNFGIHAASSSSDRD